MGGIAVERIAVTTTGSAGSASGSGYSAGALVGELLTVIYDFHASTPATADVTVKTKGSTPPSYTLAVTANTATDTIQHPRAKPVDNANTAITNAHDPFPLADIVEVAVAQADALTDAVVVWLIYRTP